MKSSRPGQRGERIAARWLRRRGYRVIARNTWVGRREIDLLAQTPCGTWLVAIEVKSGRGTFVELAERVNVRKQKKIASAAGSLLIGKSIRFDVLLVRFDSVGGWKIKHLAGAFMAPP